MHPQFSAVMAASRSDELVRTAHAAGVKRGESKGGVVAGIRRYFVHAIQIDEQPLRGAGGRTC